MILPTLADIKNVTRRMNGLKEINKAPSNFFHPVHIGSDHGLSMFRISMVGQYPHTIVNCPYGKVGDVLWVRENYAVGKEFNKVPPRDLASDTRWYYEADGAFPMHVGRCRPSIHMPFVAARIFLEIVGIKLERLSEITPESAVAEGIDRRGYATIEYRHYLKDKWGPSPVHSYQTLWVLLNGQESLDADPWVWVVTFKRLPDYKPDKLAKA